jgi:hypothetical protein
MGPGIFLTVFGAILTFAVRQGEAPLINLDVVGLILMIAGGAVIAYARHGSTHERVVTTIDDLSNPSRPTHTVIESVNDRDSGTEMVGRQPPATHHRHD